MKRQLFFATALVLTSCNGNPSTHKRQVLGSVEEYKAGVEAAEKEKANDAQAENEQVGDVKAGEEIPAGGGAADNAGGDAGNGDAQGDDAEGDAGDAPADDGDLALNGAELFQTNCASCHPGGKPGRSAQQVKNAIFTIGAMASLKARFGLQNNTGASAEIDAIAEFLNP